MTDMQMTDYAFVISFARAPSKTQVIMETASNASKFWKR